MAGGVRGLGGGDVVAGVQLRGGGVMENLPVPRDAEERENAKAWWKAGWRTTVFGRALSDELLNDDKAERFAERFIPPVGEEKMPELREPWYVITKKTGIVWHGPFTTSEAAERMWLTRNDFSRYAPSDLLTVRLAVVEVVDSQDHFRGEGGVEYRRTGDGRVVLSDPNGMGFVVPSADAPRLAALLAGKGE